MKYNIIDIVSALNTFRECNFHMYIHNSRRFIHLSIYLTHIYKHACTDTQYITKKGRTIVAYKRCLTTVQYIIQMASYVPSIGLPSVRTSTTILILIIES